MPSWCSYPHIPDVIHLTQDSDSARIQDSDSARIVIPHDTIFAQNGKCSS